MVVKLEHLRSAAGRAANYESEIMVDDRVGVGRRELVPGGAHFYSRFF